MTPDEGSRRVVKYETLPFELRERERVGEIKALIEGGIYNRWVMNYLSREIIDSFGEDGKHQERGVTLSARLEQLKKMHRLPQIDIPLSYQDLERCVYNGISMRLQRVGDVDNECLRLDLDAILDPDEPDKAIIRLVSYDLLIEPVTLYLSQEARRAEEEEAQPEGLQRRMEAVARQTPIPYVHPRNTLDGRSAPYQQQQPAAIEKTGIIRAFKPED